MTAAERLGNPIEPLRALALSVARCTEVEAAAKCSEHPCHEVVQAQAGSPAIQLPEAWAGNLADAKILFLSSNPSISTPKQGEPSSSAEAYPDARATDDVVADFVLHRFDGYWALPEGKHRRLDGKYTYVHFWGAIRKVATDLLGYAASPAADYVMTELVHCKSVKETGVTQALPRCSELHLERIIAASPAQVIVVVGSKARDRAAALWDLPWKGSDVPAVARTVAGRRRTLVQLAHPAAFGPKEMVSTKYPEAIARLRSLALAES